MADKKKNFKAMADDDLRKDLDGLTKSLHGLRTQTVTSTVENKALFRSHRRDIARILKEMRARELAKPAVSAAPAAAKPAAPPASPSAKATGDKPAKASKKKASAKSSAVKTSKP
ncbi:MAG TPA: 50S ribosomal protein L29 [Planctomycetota bacterium]|nr:50S ribosomal protein L29 [Planctomycetota bacterium]